MQPLPHGLIEFGHAARPQVDRPEVRGDPGEHDVGEVTGDHRGEAPAGGLDGGPGVVGHGHRVIDAGREPAVAPGPPGQPQFERVDPPGALERAVAVVVLGVELVGLEEVVGAAGEAGAQAGGVPHQQRRALLGDAHHLVEVPDERVRPIDSGHPVPLVLGEQGGAAVAAIDVEPQVVFLADIRDGVEVVEGRRHGRPCRGDHRQGGGPVLVRLFDGRRQFVGDHGPVEVDVDFDHGVGTEAEQGGRLRGGVMPGG